MHGPNTDTHPVSFSAVYVNLRHNRLCLPEYLPNGYFNITLCVCMYPSVEALSETRYLNHASLSHALSLRVRASACAAAAERRKRSACK